MLPDTEQFNVSFVKAIEAYRELYDVNADEYSKKEEHDKAWKSVARQFASTEKECKGRWRHLRNALSRYMRKRTSDKAKKPYYLWEQMQFVVPYMKSKQFGSIPYPQDWASMDSASLHDENEEKASISAAEIAVEIKEPHTPSSSSGSSLIGKNAFCKTARNKHCDTLENAVTEYFANKKRKKESNPDLDFFKSILPDIAYFTPSQKRRFKIGVLQLIDKLSEESEGNTVELSASMSSGRSTSVSQQF